MFRQRYRAYVALLTAAFIASNLGCSTGAFRQALSPNAQAHNVTLPSQAASSEVQTASYDMPHRPSQVHDQGVVPAQYNVPYTTEADYANVDLDVDQVVRGQGYSNGPLKEALFNPYVIGAAIIAGIAIPLAVDNREFPVGGP